MNTIDRFKLRKRILKDIECKIGSFNLVDQSLVDVLHNSDIGFNSVRKNDDDFSKAYAFVRNIYVTEQEAGELLNSLEKGFDEQRFNDLIISCKKDILSAIVGPFGLGFIVSGFDKNGGNVTTVHNFEQGVTATEEDAQRYREWKSSKAEFKRDPYDYDPKLDRAGNPVLNKNGHPQKTQFNSTKKKEIYNKKENGEPIVDGYTGKKLGKKEHNQIKKDAQIDLEHITSVKEIETDSKNHLFSQGNSSDECQRDRVEVARDGNNLTLIEGSMNSSKGEKDLYKWADKPNSKDPSKTNAEYYELDSDLIKKEYKKSNDFLKKENFKRQFKKQGKEIAITGASEGLKMGIQQALGLVLCEFFGAVFDELQDIYKHGFSNGVEDERFFNILKERLLRIAKRVAARWKDACNAFAGGFLSNLVTVMINMFIRTGKRVVRVIREGFFSLLRAIKMICYPPEGMTFEQAAHEASKLIAAGLAVVGGIALEQQIDNMIKAAPFLEPFADILTTILIGGLTGLATTFIVYAIDKIDIFKVNDKEKHDSVMTKLESNLEAMFSRSECLIETISLSS